MSPVNKIIASGVLPDFILRYGIRSRLSQVLKQHVKKSDAEQKLAIEKYVDELKTMPVAVNTEDANDQHYELPPEFFTYCLGPRLKYSSAYFETGRETLAQAEEAMLKLTCERAELSDGQKILELGCGWGSLTLWMAENYPNSQITAVSNSAPQKQHIDRIAKEKGFENLTVRTENMITYEGEGEDLFDRVVSVEMFEHMKNYEILLGRIASWLKPGGKLFVHIFTHQRAAYHYEVQSDDDWMAKYFFTGGQMPSDDLLLHFQDNLTNTEHWQVPGTHYQITSEKWLENMDAHKEAIMPLFDKTYGSENSKMMWNYWRVFYLACAELWGYKDGTEWIVSHYLFKK